MKKITILVAVIFGAVSLANAQSKISYSVFNVDNKKMISSDNENYEVDTTILSVKTDNIKKIPFKIIRYNKLGYADIELPSNLPFDSAIRIMEMDNNISKIIYSVRGKYGSMSSNDTYYNSQWGLRAINAPQAWDYTTGDASVIVAVIDAGVDWSHPDLGMGSDMYHNLYINLYDQWNQFGVPNSGDGIDNDNNGLTDDYLGWK